ncbi:MAG: peptidylprolyl isomerase [Alphaproteobacteria bacterium]
MTLFDRFTRVVAPAFVFLFSALVAGAQTTDQAAGNDPVVAVVNGKDIHFSEVAEVQRNLPDQYQMLPLEAIFPTLLERLIDLHLIVVEGRKTDLQNDEAVRRRMAQIEDRVIREVYIVRYVDKVVTEEVLLARYDAFKQQNPPQDEVRARHILVESEEEAKAVIGQIEGGADFAELAKEKSTGPSAAQGGDIGYFTRDAVVPEFSEAAFGLQPGEVTDVPVQTSFGWHVIKVEDRRLGAQPSFEEAREQLTAEASQEALSELMTSLRETAAIERFNMDGSPITTTPDSGATSE